jgi:class 3 adenylate cyclase
VAFVDDLRGTVGSIFQGKWSVEAATKVPEPADLRLNENHGKRLADAVVLYADIDGSTDMVNSNSDTFAAEVYKAYLHCASQIIKQNGGVITAYDGDRVMGIFYDAGNRNTGAASAALALNYAVEEIIRPAYAFYKNGFNLQHVVGVDRSDLLAARVGVRGDNDIVWVGRAANYAAKFCAFSPPPLWISSDVYDRISDSAKYHNGTPSGTNMWASDWKVVGTKVVNIYSSAYRKWF